MLEYSNACLLILNLSFPYLQDFEEKLTSQKRSMESELDKKISDLKDLQ